MQCLKIELHAVTAVTAVVVVMMVSCSTILANTNQEKQENDPAG